MPDYIVKSGDTLWKLAKENGMTVKQLAELNGIKDPNKIRVGQELIFSRPEQPATETTVGRTMTDEEVQEKQKSAENTKPLTEDDLAKINQDIDNIAETLAKDYNMTKEAALEKVNTQRQTLEKACQAGSAAYEVAVQAIYADVFKESTKADKEKPDAEENTDETVPPEKVEYTVQPGDILYNIVRDKYGLKNHKDIMEAVGIIRQENGIDPKSSRIPKKLNLPATIKINDNDVQLDNDAKVKPVVRKEPTEAELKAKGLQERPGILYDGKKVWIDPKTNKEYTYENGTFVEHTTQTKPAKTEQQLNTEKTEKDSNNKVLSTIHQNANNGKFDSYSVKIVVGGKEKTVTVLGSVMIANGNKPDQPLFVDANGNMYSIDATTGAGQKADNVPPNGITLYSGESGSNANHKIGKIEKSNGNLVITRYHNHNSKVYSKTTYFSNSQKGYEKFDNSGNLLVSKKYNKANSNVPSTVVDYKGGYKATYQYDAQSKTYKLAYIENSKSDKKVNTTQSIAKNNRSVVSAPGQGFWQTLSIDEVKKL